LITISSFLRKHHILVIGKIHQQLPEVVMKYLFVISLYLWIQGAVTQGNTNIVSGLTVSTSFTFQY